MKKALLIGIDYVDTPDVSLRGCANDVITVRAMLISEYGYHEDNIVVLCDDNGFTTEQERAMTVPTKTNILNEIDKLCRESEHLDEIWIHYSGHGSQLQDQNTSTPITTVRDIIIPSNYQDEGVIRDNELLQKIQTIATRCPAILVFDCCHSGTICDMPWTFEIGPGPEYAITKTHLSDLVMENQHIYVFSGCRDSQSSADSENSEHKPMGAFTNAFIECLRESKYYIDVMTLYRKTCLFLLDAGYEQSPVFSSSSPNPNWMLKHNRIQ
jgi:hypothetical protein